MQILTHTPRSTSVLVNRPPALSTALPEASGDSVTLGALQPAPRKPGGTQPKKSSRWKNALIGGAVGALAGSVGGAIGGSVGSVAVAPVVAFMGGAAAASTYQFRGGVSREMTAQAEARSLFTRVAGAGLAGAAVVALGASGGWVGAVAAGIGGLATGAALGYGIGS